MAELTVVDQTIDGKLALEVCINCKHIKNPNEVNLVFIFIPYGDKCH